MTQSSPALLAALGAGGLRVVAAARGAPGRSAPKGWWSSGVGRGANLGVFPQGGHPVRAGVGGRERERVMRGRSLCAPPVVRWRRDVCDLTGNDLAPGQGSCGRSCERESAGLCQAPGPPLRTAGEIRSREVVGRRPGQRQELGQGRTPARGSAVVGRGKGSWRRPFVNVLGAGSAAGVAAGSAAGGEVCAGSCGGEARSAQAR